MAPPVKEEPSRLAQALDWSLGLHSSRRVNQVLGKRPVESMSALHDDRDRGDDENLIALLRRSTKRRRASDSTGSARYYGVGYSTESSYERSDPPEDQATESTPDEKPRVVNTTILTDLFNTYKTNAIKAYKTNALKFQGGPWPSAQFLREYDEKLTQNPDFVIEREFRHDMWKLSFLLPFSAEELVAKVTAMVKSAVQAVEKADVKGNTTILTDLFELHKDRRVRYPGDRWPPADIVKEYEEMLTQNPEYVTGRRFLMDMYKFSICLPYSDRELAAKVKDAVQGMVQPVEKVSEANAQQNPPRRRSLLNLKDWNNEPVKAMATVKVEPPAFETFYPFMRLPLELREKIYEEVLVCDRPITPRLCSKSHGIKFHDNNQKAHNAISWRLPITRVSKQVREESLPLFYKSNVFACEMDTPIYFERLIQLGRFNSIHRVDLPVWMASNPQYAARVLYDMQVNIAKQEEYIQKVTGGESDFDWSAISLDTLKQHPVYTSGGHGWIALFTVMRQLSNAITQPPNTDVPSTHERKLTLQIPHKDLFDLYSSFNWFRQVTHGLGLSIHYHESSTSLPRWLGSRGSGLIFEWVQKLQPKQERGRGHIDILDRRRVLEKAREMFPRMDQEMQLPVKQCYMRYSCDGMAVEWFDLGYGDRYEESEEQEGDDAEDEDEDGEEDDDGDEEDEV